MATRYKRIWIGVAVIIVALCTYVASEYLAQKKVAHLQSEITEAITVQKTAIASLARVTARNGADSDTDLIIKDCASAERKEFDVLLGRLDQGLSSVELTRLDRLFGRCGTFFAERKLIMVDRLEREIEVYAQLVAQLETLTHSTKDESELLVMWQTLANEEKKQADLFMKLVTAQDKIITTLLSGKSADSVDIKEILRDVGEIQGTLSVANIQTANLRAQLLSE